MKQLFAILIISASMLLLPSCKEGNDNDGKTRVIQDSLVTVLPTWQALHIKVSEDRSQMTVVVGDATFYKAAPELKAKKADELGRMILRIYGPGNYLQKGTLIVTNDIQNTADAPPDGISTPIDFAKMKGAGVNK